MKFIEILGGVIGECSPEVIDAALAAAGVAAQASNNPVDPFAVEVARLAVQLMRAP